MLKNILLLTIVWFSYSLIGKLSLRNKNLVKQRLCSKYFASNNNNDDDALVSNSKVLEDLRGTPELVDTLEGLVSKHPGLELNLNLYRHLYPFKLDSFQEQGLIELIAGNNVVVTTPTGSGKTLVGELAIYFALMMGLRVAYTTPLKALSNQKFQDFSNRYGGDRVGLLTGDVAINRGAAVTVMTTEVFRNMVYDSESDSQLSNLFMVVFDEFHYMNDPERGTVWEESVISCPSSVRILALSATMGNVGDIQGWMEAIHGPTKLVVSDYRPVPLRYYFGMKQGLFPLFRNPNAGPGALAGVQRITESEEQNKVTKDNSKRNNTKKSRTKLAPGCELNPTIVKFEDQVLLAAKQAAAAARGGGKIGGVGRPYRAPKANPNSLIPRYTDLVKELNSLEKVPAIVFIFSRAGCEQAGKMVMQGGTKLLNIEELRYINSRINRFMIDNPEIPVDKSSIRMLRAGVGVHHAGLITVWKAFIEDLFNANMIKVLFATETLAAGVNMPARTTVISTVTKRINSNVIKLKTSQLLQMAGRAGRRGKDTEGSVVILRNRFEDSRVGHRILLAPIDDIKSHFRTSYSLAIKMLETRTLDECRQLIEKGFGSYLAQQRRKKQVERLEKKHSKSGVTPEMLNAYRSALNKFTFDGAREFIKLQRRLDKEQRGLEFLIDQMIMSEVELVQAIADYMPVGTGLVLRNDEAGFFLGDVKWGDDNCYSGLGVLTKNLRVLVAQKDHIRTFAETADSIPPIMATKLLDLFSMAKKWEELPVDPLVGKKGLMEGKVDMSKAWKDENLATAMKKVQESADFPSTPLPSSVLRQKAIVENLQKQLDDHPISQAEEEEAKIAMEALSYATKQKDPVKFVKSLLEQSNDVIYNAADSVAAADSAATGSAGSDSNAGDVFAWRMFQSVYFILQNFKALNGTQSTQLGETIGSFTADNELWLALVLNHPIVQELEETELAGLMSALVIDGYKATNAYFKNRPSDKLKGVFEALLPLQWELKLRQESADIDFPVNLCGEAAGLIESWANGTSWRDLCRETSLEQGDVCRLLRRTVEVLRQIPNAYGISPSIGQTAYNAINKMDRFPVTDTIDEIAIESQKLAAENAKKKSILGGAGVGFEFSPTRNTSDELDSDDMIDLTSDVDVDLESEDDVDEALIDLLYESSDGTDADDYEDEDDEYVNSKEDTAAEE